MQRMLFLESWERKLYQSTSLSFRKRRGCKPLFIIMVKHVGFFLILLVIADKEYQLSSFDDLISLKIGDNTLINIMAGIEVQHC